MMFLDPIKNFINKIDVKTFQYYALGYCAACLVLSGLIIVYYYSSISSLKKEIRTLNVSRSQVVELLEEFEKIKQQQVAVEEILAKDPNFKIQGEFGDLIKNLKLKDKEAPEEILNTIDFEDNYRKNELSVKFDGMTMQELTKLLEEIEQNPRIATERLEITRSKNKTIDVALTISTLLPKIESTTA